MIAYCRECKENPRNTTTSTPFPKADRKFNVTMNADDAQASFQHRFRSAFRSFRPWLNSPAQPQTDLSQAEDINDLGQVHSAVPNTGPVAVDFRSICPISQRLI